MRSIFTTILFAGLIYLSSCSTKDDSSTYLFPIPSADSVTKNSDIKVVFSSSDSVEVHDLTVQNVPVENLIASITYNPSDSTYTTKIILTDNLSKLISINLSAQNSSNDPLSTPYLVTTNSSTFTDFRGGINKTYAIGLGSSITVTSATYPITGTMNLNLYYNTTTTPVTGTFSIYK